MRWLFLLAGLTAAALQTGCTGTPESLGITGPGPQAEPDLNPADATMQAPGVPNPDNGLGTDQRYYHYN